ncbi:hypothetical protein ALC57_02617 [Trachymyrmex cornetzi]|uniref:Uncharacterized protein n=1 Tax=Trachymyrmex cornetzi TaxID=471704 RepID=A0A151JNF7_9HYME|nr:hypothetical protein ALC57_02617 [Trachymyrmex cornetzi]
MPRIPDTRSCSRRGTKARKLTRSSFIPAFPATATLSAAMQALCRQGASKREDEMRVERREGRYADTEERLWSFWTRGSVEETGLRRRGRGAQRETLDERALWPTLASPVMVG